jgi:hypothetical protein
MSLYELDISWAASADELRQLRWELLSCDQVRGVFLTGRDETIAVLFDGDRDRFEERRRSLQLPATA